MFSTIYVKLQNTIVLVFLALIVEGVRTEKLCKEDKLVLRCKQCMNTEHIVLFHSSNFRDSLHFHQTFKNCKY